MIEDRGEASCRLLTQIRSSLVQSVSVLSPTKYRIHQNLLQDVPPGNYNPLALLHAGLRMQMVDRLVGDMGGRVNGGVSRGVYCYTCKYERIEK